MSDTTSKVTVETKPDNTIGKVQIETTEDNSGLGLPSRVDSYLTQSDWRNNWHSRNVFVFCAIACVGLLFTLIVLSVLYYLLFIGDKPINPTIASVLKTLVWTLVSVFMALTGATFFGKHFDATSWRQNAVDLLKNVK